MTTEQINVSDQVGVKVVKGGEQKPPTPEEIKKAQDEALADAQKMVDVECKLTIMNGLKLYLEHAAKRANTTFEELLVSLAWDMSRIYSLIPPEELGEIVALKKKEQQILAKHRGNKVKEHQRKEAREKRKSQKKARKKNR